ncbi:MAG: sulfite exporter TauE/SafE family protein [Bacteroidetes bacterium]|nr:sulfite exporter TauE/SafE family protein [Bacteroidota bacterium]
MDVLQILGYIGALLTGLVLGLLGGGGAAVSIPILVYAFGVEASIATGYSLLIVAFTALFGSIQNIRLGHVRYGALAKCGLPALISIYVMRRYLIHSIPDVFFSYGSFTLTKNSFILFILAFFMIIVARNMIWPRPSRIEPKPEPYLLVLVQSVIIGLFTGLVGAGGGFLLIPLILAVEPMEFRNATATSLVLVTLNSTIGFIGDLQSHLTIDWVFLGTFVALSAAGVLGGIAIANKVDNVKLRRIFGYTMMAIAIYILIREVTSQFR